MNTKKIRVDPQHEAVTCIRKEERTVRAVLVNVQSRVVSENFRHIIVLAGVVICQSRHDSIDGR